jgi:hypothetical protein
MSVPWRRWNQMPGGSESEAELSDGHAVVNDKKPFLPKAGHNGWVTGLLFWSRDGEQDEGLPVV